jgi:hypothetical protein
MTVSAHPTLLQPAIRLAGSRRGVFETATFMLFLGANLLHLHFTVLYILWLYGGFR